MNLLKLMVAGVLLLGSMSLSDSAQAANTQSAQADLTAAQKSEIGKEIVNTMVKELSSPQLLKEMQSDGFTNIVIKGVGNVVDCSFTFSDPNVNISELSADEKQKMLNEMNSSFAEPFAGEAQLRDLLRMCDVKFHFTFKDLHGHSMDTYYSF